MLEHLLRLGSGAFAGFAGANLSRCCRPQAATSSVATRYTCFSVRGRWSVPFLAPRHVHRDFHAKPKVNRLWNLPSHKSLLRTSGFPHFLSRPPSRAPQLRAKILTHHFVSVKNEGHHARRTVLRRITRSSSSCLLTPEGCAYRLPQEAGVVGAASTFGIPLSLTRALQRVRSARKKAVKSPDVVRPLRRLHPRFLSDLGSTQYVSNRPIQLRNDLSWRACGRQNAGPDAQFIIVRRQFR